MQKGNRVVAFFIYLFLTHSFLLNIYLCILKINVLTHEEFCRYNYYYSFCCLYS